MSDSTVAIEVPAPASARRIRLVREWPQFPHRHDLIGLGVVLIVIAALIPTYFQDGLRIIGQDATVYYLPQFSYLGERLASFDIPAWNPYQYGGTPFAADPESGWMYLPSMILYTLFPIGLATTLFLIVHFLLTGVGAYLFGRVLGLNVPGATVAGVAYISNHFFYRFSVSSPAYVQAATWLPWGFLFIELSFRTTNTLRRLLYAGLASFAFGQVIAAWLGKGAYYSLLIYGAYVVYRSLIQPPHRNWSLRYRALTFATVAAAMGVWTFLLSAGGLLPRLQYHGVSNLASGYQSGADRTSGGSLISIPGRYIGRAQDAPGDIILVLAIIALFIAGARYAAPFFVGALVATTFMIADDTLWFVKPFELLPEFETIHYHFPQQIKMIQFLPFAILAGIAVSIICERRTRLAPLYLALSLPGVILWITGFDFRIIPQDLRIMTVSGLILVALIPMVRIPQSGRMALVCVMLVLHLVPLFQRSEYITTRMAAPIVVDDLDDYFSPNGAVEFIREQQRKSGVPVRYFGYDTSLGQSVNERWTPYRRQFYEPRAVAIQVNNRATVFHLYDVQGQNNPIQIGRYQDLFVAINGFAQDYHEAAVFEEGFDSPYLDLLNVRYIILPSIIPADRTDFRTLLARYEVVYAGDDAIVLERPTYYQRAWLMHSAVPVDNANDAFSLVSSKAIDPAVVAPVEGRLPSLTAPADGASDRVTIQEYEPERIRYKTKSDVESLLVTSEIEFPGWNAYVDGEKVPTNVAYGAFRAVVVPAGEHTVEFRFESRTLLIGTGISVFGYLALIGFGGYVLIQDRRQRLEA